jgi:hypothetical protein
MTKMGVLSRSNQVVVALGKSWIGEVWKWCHLRLHVSHCAALFAVPLHCLRRIRNFLTLFLSIEVSKAMREATDAKREGDETRSTLAQKRVDCFTSQLNDSNPILTKISDAMTEEGRCLQEMEAAVLLGDGAAAASWKEKMEAANKRKQEGNSKLMSCSAQYEAMMRSIREASE